MPYPLLLHSKHRGTEVTYQSCGPWVVPWAFEALETEYQALREGVGLIDASTQALIEVRGEDRAAFLHNLLTNDIKRLSPGTGCRAALLTANAKLIAELFVFADADAFWLLCDATRAETLIQTLERYLITEQVTLTNHDRRQAVLALEGPRSMELLSRLCDRVIALPHPGDHLVVSLHGITVRLLRHSLAGGVGVLCLVEGQDAEPAWEFIRRAGHGAGLRLVGWHALNVARIEAGIPWFGMDMDESNLLPETGLERIVASETKGCYLGQEIVARLSTYGSVTKKLVGLLVEGAEVPASDDRIVGAPPASSSDDALGHVTSACGSLALRHPIALGYLKRGAYEPGTRVAITHEGRRLAATVTTLPFTPAH